MAAVASAQRTLGVRLSSFLLLPSWGEPPHYTLLVEDADMADGELASRLAAEVERELAGLNLEYENRRTTRRLGPIRTRRIPAGSWSEFQKRRLARSGGTVEQYKQPHLMPDLGALETFRSSDAVTRAIAD